MLSTGFLIHVSLPQKYTVHWHSLPLLGFFSPPPLFSVEESEGFSCSY